MNAAHHTQRTIAGALVARLVLDKRDVDAEALARDFGRRGFGAPKPGADGDAAFELGREHGPGVLAAALVERLDLDGRAEDARQLGRVFLEMGLTRGSAR